MNFNDAHLLTFCRLDIKVVFHEGLKLLEKRVLNRFYTTATAFAQDFGNVFHNGIVSQPAPQLEQPLSSELKKPIVTDIRERRRLAKRIIKTIQPQLQAAVRAEADISGKSAEILVRDLDQLLETSIQSNGDTISVSIGDTGSQVDVDSKNEVDVQLMNSVEVGTEDAHIGQLTNGSEDVEMQDSLVSGEDANQLTGSSNTNGSTNSKRTDTTLTEVDGNISQSNSEHANGVKIGKHHDNNGDTATLQMHNPPTPPLSNGDSSNGHNSNFLVAGGTPWFLEEFHPDGTSILQEKWTGRDAVARLSEDLSDMDEATLNGLLSIGEANEEISVPPPNATKTKKAKAKRSRKR
jgi:NuA3 HAT complex component NTO1